MGEALPGLGNEWQVVTAGFECELEDAESVSVAQFTVWLDLTERAMIFSACANDKFADSALCIGEAIGSLRGEPLVVMVVAVDDDVSIGLIERFEEWLNGKIVPVRAASTEERLFPQNDPPGGRILRATPPPP